MKKLMEHDTQDSVAYAIRRASLYAADMRDNQIMETYAAKRGDIALAELYRFFAAKAAAQYQSWIDTARQWAVS